MAQTMARTGNSAPPLNTSHSLIFCCAMLPQNQNYLIGPHDSQMRRSTMRAWIVLTRQPVIQRGSVRLLKDITVVQVCNTSALPGSTTNSSSKPLLTSGSLRGLMKSIFAVQILRSARRMH
jgi:hypothetical protein